MSSIRVCLVLLVMLVQFNSIHSKPFFFDLLCDIFCDDDDSSTTTTTSSSADDDYFDICDCTPRPRRPNRRGQQQFAPSAFNMRLPPSNGMNVSLNSTNGVWSFNLDALRPGQPGSVTPLGFGPSSAPPATIGGGSTAAGTTVAPTTAK